MHSSRNRWLLYTFVIIATLILLGIYLKSAASAPRVAASFLSYTNAGNSRFAVIPFINHERVPVKWGDTYVGEDDSSAHHAPIFNPNLPNWRGARQLESGGLEVIAVGTPSDAQARWRFCWDYSPVGSTNNYTVHSKWFTRWNVAQQNLRSRSRADTFAAISALGTGEGRVAQNDAARYMLDSVSAFRSQFGSSDLAIVFSLPSFCDYEAFRSTIFWSHSPLTR
jgi:hypothetical protein